MFAHRLLKIRKAKEIQEMETDLAKSNPKVMLEQSWILRQKVLLSETTTGLIHRKILLTTGVKAREDIYLVSNISQTKFSNTKILSLEAKLLG